MTKTIDQYLQTKGPIVVGNDVWIGARAIILSGVTIGNGAVVAAGSGNQGCSALCNCSRQPGQAD
ncbi:DapH/DapD/GlmU-related protein [Mesorhizobium sp. M4B.F.Ca.ET.017.02.2.1]|uniref:DapH/DapD/GlmU-related protein n=1 Tax=Mesorhizobium sp. M4B.F.Ca.ET.017.02.2.1 TaxID=2496649 RepID=UPI00247A87EE|nr:DapH/DapD/GlmU-related protein [Mesorhizobium sp. M4B.F.Ca.ET.017.02.2.1]